MHNPNSFQLHKPWWQWTGSNVSNIHVVSFKLISYLLSLMTPSPPLYLVTKFFIVNYTSCNQCEMPPCKHFQKHQQRKKEKEVPVEKLEETREDKETTRWISNCVLWTLLFNAYWGTDAFPWKSTYKKGNESKCRCFRPLFCIMKDDLGRGQPVLMRWNFYGIYSRTVSIPRPWAQPATVQDYHYCVDVVFFLYEGEKCVHAVIIILERLKEMQQWKKWNAMLVF